MIIDTDKIIYIYIYIIFSLNTYIYEKDRKTKSSKSDKFIIKESQCYNVSAFVNLHQDFKMLKQVLLEQQWMF